MGKYILKFNNHTEYLNNENSLEDPNVSYCINEDEVHYKPYDYSKDYLTFIARETGTFSFSKLIYYSIDLGKTWVSLAASTQSPTVEINNTIMWRYANNGANGVSDIGIGTFTSTGEFDIQGNIMSLRVNTNDFSNATLSTYIFYNLFKNSKVINAKYLVLPVTTLTSNCYRYMFQGCTSLVTAPKLPATTLATYCYQNMFQGCTSLVTTPELPATTLATYCYQYMFSGCTSLTTAPKLLATTLATYCYEGMFKNCTSLITAPKLTSTTLSGACYYEMFYGCSSLTSAPELPATTLADYCYYYMFYGCTSLITAPELPATILAQYCYAYMFYGCTSLTTTPEILPAIILVSNCYAYMFKGCTSLTTAPELYTLTLTNSCYYQMFYNCSNLNYIKCLATNVSASNCLYYWTSGVASSGTFIRNSAMSSWPTGVSGIPSGWTVQTTTL